MSWDFYKNKQVKARKEYSCDWQDHLQLCDIITRDPGSKQWVVNIDQCKEYGFTEDDIKTVQAYIDCDFKIAKGELHSVTSGKTEGEFMEFRGKIAISEIMHRLDLVE